MTLEQRLIETLHRADDFEPSPDLFARVERSLEEHRRHRHRIIGVAVGLLAGTIAAVLLLQVSISHSVQGRLTASGWVLELIVALAKIALILVLGPNLRRLGHPLIADVFRLDPPTGKRFLKLLDIAFYLFLFGLMLFEAYPQLWGQEVTLAEDAWLWTGSLATFMLLMGLGHIATIATLPVIGLFHSSLVRRDRREEAGSAVSPSSVRAEQAEKVVRLMVWGIAGLALLGILLAVGVLLFAGIARV